MMMNFSELSEFKKEFRQLSKKYKSLPDDLQIFRRIVSTLPLGNSKHFNIIIKTDSCYILKARLFCRYLKGSSLRIIYAYYKQEHRIEFIELYFKGNKQNENRERIKMYIKKVINDNKTK